MTPSLRTLLGPLALAAACTAACTVSKPGADTTKAVPPADATPAASPAPAVVDTQRPVVGTRTAGPTPAAPAPTPVPAPAPAAPARATRPDTTPTRSRLTPRPPHPVPRPMPATDDSDVTEATIARLRREAKALVHTDGCATAGDCAVLPLGERACGGPEEYLVYCPTTTNVAALHRKAAELARAEQAFNAKTGVISTCELRTPPTATLVGGSCRAAASGGAGAPARQLP